MLLPSRPSGSLQIQRRDSSQLGIWLPCPIGQQASRRLVAEHLLRSPKDLLALKAIGSLL